MEQELVRFLGAGAGAPQPAKQLSRRRSN